METKSFNWFWKIEPLSWVKWGFIPEQRFAAVVIGTPKISNVVAVRFQTTAHTSADKAHQEIIKIITRTENEIEYHKGA